MWIYTWPWVCLGSRYWMFVWRKSLHSKLRFWFLGCNGHPTWTVLVLMLELLSFLRVFFALRRQNSYFLTYFWTQVPHKYCYDIICIINVFKQACKPLKPNVSRACACEWAKKRVYMLHVAYSLFLILLNFHPFPPFLILKYLVNYWNLRWWQWAKYEGGVAENAWKACGYSFWGRLASMFQVTN